MKLGGSTCGTCREPRAGCVLSKGRHRRHACHCGGNVSIPPVTSKAGKCFAHVCKTLPHIYAKMSLMHAWCVCELVSECECVCLCVSSKGLQ